MGKSFSEKRGEALEKNIIEVLWHTDGYGHLLKNLYLPKVNEKETELDIVFIHETGIYVIEAKNYSGKIYADEKYDYWKKYIHGKEYSFYSPLEQNRNHIKALQRHLPESIKRTDIYSIIVFGDDCEIKKMEVNTHNVTVLQLNELKSYIQNIVFDDSNESIFTSKEIDLMRNNLLQFEKRNKEVRENRPLLREMNNKPINNRTSVEKAKIKPKFNDTKNSRHKKKGEKPFGGKTLVIILFVLFALFYNSYLDNSRKLPPTQSQQTSQILNVVSENQEETDSLSISNKEINDAIQNAPNQRVTEKEAYALIDTQLAKDYLQGFKKNHVVGNYQYSTHNESHHSFSRSTGTNSPSELLKVVIYSDNKGVKEVKLK